MIWLIPAVGLVVVLSVLFLLWDDKRTWMPWTTVFYRAPLTWGQYFRERFRRRR